MDTLLSQQTPEYQAAWNHREARFYRATGYLAPWKRIPVDMPPEVRARQHLYELRQKAWDTWKAVNEHADVKRVMWGM